MLTEWIGRTESRKDRISARPILALAATLDRDDARPRTGDAIPALAHWLYFPGAERQSGIGPDGHPARGGFLPPVPLPRRMFAGASLEFVRPIRVGDRVERVSTIADVKHKAGRSGSLVFVTVRHEVYAEGALALIEDQNIVYREEARGSATPAPAANPGPRHCEWRREIVADEVMLFRFSALTFNSHRIHYDHRYAMQVEGYPGLVVHGPLIATLLADLVRRHRPGEALKSFSFRAQRPLFATSPFTVCGATEGMTTKLWAEDASGAVAMEATASCV